MKSTAVTLLLLLSAAVLAGCTRQPGDDRTPLTTVWFENRYNETMDFRAIFSNVPSCDESGDEQASYSASEVDEGERVMADVDYQQFTVYVGATHCLLAGAGPSDDITAPDTGKIVADYTVPAPVVTFVLTSEGDLTVS